MSFGSVPDHLGTGAGNTFPSVKCKGHSEVYLILCKLVA